MRADVYLAGSNALHRWALGRTMTHRIANEDVRIAPIEYVIVYKLLYVKQGGSDRHLRAGARMIEIRGPAIDQGALDGWIEKRGVAREWARARAKVGVDD